MKEKEVWYKQLGFYNNPFSIKPAAFYDELLGYEDIMKKVNHSIATNKLVYVEGDYGNGKSTLLRRVLHRFGGKGRLIYFSCNRIEKSLNISKLLNGRYGFLGKLLNLKPKNMILLLDEAQWLPKEDYARVLRYYRGGYFKSIVFVGKDFDESHFSDGFKNSLEHVKLGEVNEDNAVSIIRKRVGNLPLLTDDNIRFIFEKTSHNVRKLLKYSEMVCKTAIEREEDFVTAEMIEEIFAENGHDEEVEEKTEKTTKKAEVQPPSEAEEVKEEMPEEKKEELKVEPVELTEEDLEEEKTREEIEEEEVEEILDAEPTKEVAEVTEHKAKSKTEKYEELYY